MKEHLTSPEYTFIPEELRVNNLSKPRLFNTLLFHVAEFHPEHQELKQLIEYGEGQHLNKSSLEKRTKAFVVTSSVRPRMSLEKEVEDMIEERIKRHEQAKSMKVKRRVHFNTDLELPSFERPDVLIVVDESLKARNMIRRFSEYPRNKFVFVTQKWIVDSCLQGAPVVICEALHQPCFNS